MHTTTTELQHNLKNIMLAVDRNEPVIVMHNGKPKAEIIAIAHRSQSNVRKHPFFAMSSEQISVETEINRLRADRY